MAKEGRGMMVGSSGFEFEHSAYSLLFLFLVPLGLVFFYAGRKLVFERITLGSSFIPFEKGSAWIWRLFPFLILSLLLLALMGPRGNPHYSDKEIEKREQMNLMSAARGNVILILDSSASMLATDTSNRESRFEAAKQLLDGLLESPIQPNYTLYALGSELVKVVPRTLDKVFLRLLLKQVAINDGGAGTTFLEAFETLKDDLKTLPDPIAIVLATDGDDTTLEEASTDEKNLTYKNVLKEVLGDPPRQIPLYGLVFGTKEGSVVPGVAYRGQPVVSKRNEEFIHFLSTGSGGKSWVFNDHNSSALIEELVLALKQAGSPNEASTLANSQDSLIWDSYFQFPLFMALVLFIIYALYPQGAKPHFQRGALMLALVAGEGELNRKMTIFLEAGNEAAAFQLLEESLSPDNNPWVKGAILFNQAALKDQAGRL